MAVLDGAAAIAWMRNHTSNQPGMCLNTVWQAYGSVPSTGPRAGTYSDAVDGWDGSIAQHPGDWNPPAGVPVYFGISPTRTDANARAGDVMLSLGGGTLIGTDVGTLGRIGTTSIASRAAATARPYLGWTGDFLGHQVAYPGSTPTEDDMPNMNEFLNSPAFDGGPTISQVFEATWQVYNAIFAGGPSMDDKGQSIAKTLADLAASQEAKK